MSPTGKEEKNSTPSPTLGERHIFGCAFLKRKCTMITFLFRVALFIRLHYTGCKKNYESGVALLFNI